nr:transcription factor ste11 [Quercus suber]
MRCRHRSSSEVLTCPHLKPVSIDSSPLQNLQQQHKGCINLPESRYHQLPLHLHLLSRPSKTKSFASTNEIQTSAASVRTRVFGSSHIYQQAGPDQKARSVVDAVTLADNCRIFLSLSASTVSLIRKHSTNQRLNCKDRIPEMVSTSGVQRNGLPLRDNFDLDAVAAHNHVATMGQYYVDESLGAYVSFRLAECSTTAADHVRQGDYAAASQSDRLTVDRVLTPRSNTTSDSTHTRGGRSARRNDSPFSISRSRVSKSPMSRADKSKKSKLEKSRRPKLMAPLSVLTKDMSTPMKDMDAWVNRSLEIRRQEVEKRNGYVTRPMNSFMLYRSAYADRTKVWCTQNNHQVVSSLSGESWPMESQEVRDQFNEWARVERQNHQAAHPDYKFSPSKLNNKRRKGGYCEDEADMSSVDGDPFDKYRPARRSARRRDCTPFDEQHYQGDETMGFDSNPYFHQQGPSFHDSVAHQGLGSKDLQPYNLNGNIHQSHGLPYSMHVEQYVQPSEQEFRDYQYGREKIPENPVGGYGLPGGQQMAIEGLFDGYPASTSMLPMDEYFHQPVIANQYPYEYQPAQQLYEHQQWLETQCRPQMAIDPSLEVDLAALSERSDRHEPNMVSFGHTLGRSSASIMPEYFQEYSNSNGALAPAWNPMEELRFRIARSVLWDERVIERFTRPFDSNAIDVFDDIQVSYSNLLALFIADGATMAFHVLCISSSRRLRIAIANVPSTSRMERISLKVYYSDFTRSAFDSMRPLDFYIRSEYSASNCVENDHESSHAAMSSGFTSDRVPTDHYTSLHWRQQQEMLCFDSRTTL